MTADAFTGAPGFLARYDGLKDHLPGDSAVRASAAEAFRRMGVPGGSAGRREEAWKYTSLRPLAEAAFHEPLTPMLEIEPLLAQCPVLPRRGWCSSTGGFGRTCPIRRRAWTFARSREHPRFGPLARPDRDPMVALNTMLAEDGAWLDVPAGADIGLVQLVSIATGQPAAPPLSIRGISPAR